MLRAWSPWLAAMLCGLLLAGCAGTLPQTRPIPEDETREAMRVWTTYIRREQPAALDADLRLRWDVLGSAGAIDTVLQMKQPAWLRLAVNDPLGRSLVLVVSDGRTFTYVDNRQGVVYRGGTDSAFWRRHVPDTIQATDLFLYLGGRIDPKQVHWVRPSLDVDGQGYWYVWRDKRAVDHHLLLDRRTGAIQRHLLVDRFEKALLDLHYSGVVGVAAADSGRDTTFSWPQLLKISGEAISGTVEVDVQKIYGFTLRGANPFRLSLPPHFLLEEVD
jgi:hypothetical protein